MDLERLEENEQRLKLIIQEQKILDISESIREDEINQKRSEIELLKERIRTLEGIKERGIELPPQWNVFNPLVGSHPVLVGMPAGFPFDPRANADVYHVERQMAAMKISELQKALDKATAKYKSYKKMSRELKVRIDILLCEVERQNKVIENMHEPVSKIEEEKPPHFIE